MSSCLAYRPTFEPIESRLLPGETWGALFFLPLDLISQGDSLRSDVPALSALPGTNRPSQAVGGLEFWFLREAAASPARLPSFGRNLASESTAMPPVWDVPEALTAAVGCCSEGTGRATGGPGVDPYFVWQNPWVFRREASYDPGAWSATAFGDVGQAGDLGPAVAYALAHSNAVWEKGCGYNSASASVLFWRTFHVGGMSEGWQLTFDGFLNGRRASVRTIARIVEGAYENYYWDPPGKVVGTVDLGDYFVSGQVQEISEFRSEAPVVPDGTYTVMGAISTWASAGSKGCDGGGAGTSDFFWWDPFHGLAIAVDAAPLG